jgi:transcription elongation GreA/GreB family factor
MDKQELLSQVMSKLETGLKLAQRTALDSRDAAANLATAQEKKDDSRTGLEFGALATGHEQRARKFAEELEQLQRVRLRPFGKRDAVDMGAVVEVEDGEEGRTFFVLPVGAGTELTGPGGDGLLTVVSAASPMGRAVIGKRSGDAVEVTVQGELREWTITYVG